MKTKKTTKKKRVARKTKNSSFETHPLARADQMLAKALAALGEKIDSRMVELESVRVEKAQLEKQLDDSVTLHNENIAEMNKLRREFYDLRDHGIRFDLTPTTILSPGKTSDGTPDGTYTFKQVAEFSQRVHGFYQEYLKRIDESMRTKARIALGEVTPAEAYGAADVVGGTVAKAAVDAFDMARVHRPSDNLDEPPKD